MSTSTRICVYNFMETLVRLNITNIINSDWKLGAYFDERICDFVDNYSKYDYTSSSISSIKPSSSACSEEK